MSTSAAPVQTRWSLVLAAGADDAVGREALAWLCRQYWDVLQRHAARRGWREADDLVQDFLAHLIAHRTMAQADPARGRFRSWLLTCLDHFLVSRARAATAAKRGGGAPPVALQDGAAAPAVDDDREFTRDWALTLLARAEDRLAGEQRDAPRFAAYRPFLMAAADGAAYAAAGAPFGLGEGAVKVAVHRLRARLTALIREEIADSLAEDDPRSIDRELDLLITSLAERAAAGE